MFHHYGYLTSRGWEAMNWGWMGLHMLAWVVLIILLIYLYKRHLKHSSTAAGVPSALDILKKRYAQGEITQDEFNKMKEHVK